MEKMNDLRDLLKHEIMDLHSAEEQIIKAMPAMIAKARNPELKQSLQSHLKVTEGQLTRLQQVQGLMDAGGSNNTKEEGLLSRLFKRNYVCRGMQGLIEEGEKVMNEDMSPEVLDAAIIACAQKIEHYEICGYGTARAFASELGLTEVATLLEQTLDEEYEADDRLTGLAVNRLNERAEKSGGTRGNGARGGKNGANTRESSRQRATRPAAEMELAAAKRGRDNDDAKTAGSTRGAAENRPTRKSGAAATKVSKGTAKSAGSRGNTASGRGGTSGRGDR